MTLRAGYYSVSSFHGIIRDDGAPWYSCTHNHRSSTEATNCARQARPELALRDHSNPEAPLPKDWRVHPQRPAGFVGYE